MRTSFRASVTIFAIFPLFCMCGGCVSAPNAAWYAESPEASQLVLEHKIPKGPESYAGYFFALNTREREEFRVKVESLKLGDDLQTIVRVLGDPDYANRAEGSRVFPRAYYRLELTYVVATREKNIANDLTDADVVLVLDVWNRLESIYSTYPPIRTRGTAHIKVETVAPNWLSIKISGDPMPPAHPRWLRSKTVS
jgi:hypothetical protein